MRTIVSIAAVLFATCRQEPPPAPVPTPPAVTSDAAARPPLVFDAGSYCGRACAVLDWVGCPESRGSKFGEACEQLCEDGRKVPGLAPNPAAVMLCRDVDCVRDAGVKCNF